MRMGVTQINLANHIPRRHGTCFFQNIALQVTRQLLVASALHSHIKAVILLSQLWLPPRRAALLKLRIEPYVLASALVFLPQDLFVEELHHLLEPLLANNFKI